MKVALAALVLVTACKSDTSGVDPVDARPAGSDAIDGPTADGWTR